MDTAWFLLSVEAETEGDLNELTSKALDIGFKELFKQGEIEKVEWDLRFKD